MKKFTFSAIGLLVLAGAASAGLGSGTFSTFADNFNNGDSALALTTPGSGITAQFRASGILAPTGGVRFLNAQNTGSTQFDSWAAVRWDLTDLYTAIAADVAATPNATGAVITSVELGLYQSPFSASSPAAFDIFYIADDTTDFNPQNVAGQFGAFGGPTINFAFFTGANAFVTNGFFDNTGPVGKRDAFNIATAEVLGDLNNFNDNALTLAWQSAFGNAAYGGSSPFGNRLAPELAVSYQIIPTPGAAALLGLAGLAAVRRRRA